MIFLLRVIWVCTCIVGGNWLLSWLFGGEMISFDVAFILSAIVVVGWTLQDLIIGLGRNLDILKNEIDSPYGGLKSKMDDLERKIGGLESRMDNLEEKMDEIRRDLK